MALVGAAAPDSWWDSVTSGTYASSPASVTRAKGCALAAIRRIGVSRDVALQGALGPGLRRSIPRAWPARWPPLCWPRRERLSAARPFHRLGNHFGEQILGGERRPPSRLFKTAMLRPRRSSDGMTEFPRKRQQRAENLNESCNYFSREIFFLRNGFFELIKKKRYASVIDLTGMVHACVHRQRDAADGTPPLSLDHQPQDWRSHPPLPGPLGFARHGFRLL